MIYMKDARRTWIISDTHFNHAKMIEYCGRPHNFNDILITNCNKLVKHNDLFIWLGDVILGRDSSLAGILASIPGKKILCRGNHDHHTDEWYMDAGFDFVCDYYVYENIAFSHSPLTPLPYQTIKQHSKDKEFYLKPVDLCIHGHFHNSTKRNPKTREEKKSFKDRYYDYEYYSKNKEKYKLIQIEDVLSPFLLNDILSLERG